VRHLGAVAREARALARRFGLDPERAALAAWCHDLAAVVPRRDLIRVAEAWGVPLSDGDRAVPAVIHGLIAAAVMEKRLEIRDEEILDAVRYHTALRAGASPLEMLVFVADKIEHDPTTADVSYLPEMAAAVQARAEGEDGLRPLRRAAFVYLDFLVKNRERLGITLHANALAAHAELSVRDAHGCASRG
jgi:predicted HD superfamily hydrolase involved in NAD metabolism